MSASALVIALVATADAHAVATAVRARSAPVVDGRLDDEAWADAPILRDFVQRVPDEGRPASERTEIRLIYDDRALYVGVRCFDSRAADLPQRLSRRDDLPESDSIMLWLDTFYDRRSAYFFVVNNAGVMVDGQTIESAADDFNWDGVWTAETRADATGWTVEIRIPFSTLRFPRADAQVWGFHVRRHISRLKEDDEWHLIRITEASVVPHFEDLAGIRGVQPGLSLQLVPYGTATVRPSFQTDSLAPRDPLEGQVGLDAKYGLTGTLTLDLTINPDFAQVEVDPEVVNLSAYEVQFPEKRPFFLEGNDLFQPVNFMFYTRRIGAPPEAPDPQHDGEIVALDARARIMGAAKLSGNLRPGTALGLLGAYVDETTAIERVGTGELSPRYRLRATPPAFYEAVRVRQSIGGSSGVAVTETSVVRGGGQPDAHVGNVDLDLRGAGDYSLYFGTGWTETQACDPSRTPTFHPGNRCDAFGAAVYGGKTGGALRLYALALYLGADWDVNDMGYFAKKIGNQVVGGNAHLSYTHPRPWGPFNQTSIDLSYNVQWDPNAGNAMEPTPLVDSRGMLDVTLLGRHNWRLGVTAAHSFEHFDDAETRQNSLVRLYRRPYADSLTAYVRSDDSRRVWVQLSNAVDAENGGRWIDIPSLEVAVAAGGRLRLDARVQWMQWFDRPRWLDTAGDGFPLFGELELEQLETTLRGTFVFTRALTLQMFGQLLRSAQRYSHVFELRDPARLDPLPDTRAYDEDLTSLIVNAILRWEYHPGSTLFVAYTHNHQVSTSSLAALANSPADNILAIKLSYLWAL